MPVICFHVISIYCFEIYNATVAPILQIDGCTALTLAAMNGKAACVRLLIDAGADKEAKNGVRMRWSAASAGWAFVLVLVF
jgi:hypothetical protein